MTWLSWVLKMAGRTILRDRIFTGTGERCGNEYGNEVLKRSFLLDVNADDAHHECEGVHVPYLNVHICVAEV